MGSLGTGELLIILLIVLLVFGGAKLPKLARSLGQAQKEFKDGLTEGASRPTTTSRRRRRSLRSLSGTEPSATSGRGRGAHLGRGGGENTAGSCTPSRTGWRGTTPTREDVVQESLLRVKRGLVNLHARIAARMAGSHRDQRLSSMRHGAASAGPRPRFPTTRTG